MRLLLVRHGETVDNVAGVYAGITDSALTSHGVLQANRLANHLSATGIKVAHIFSSDLQRAARTAEAIREAQSPNPPKTKRLQLLREQDFGFYEGKKYSEKSKDGNQTGKVSHMDAHRKDPGFVEVESRESMHIRVETFIDVHLVHLMHEVGDDRSVVVVAHGIILTYLWRAILARFRPFVTVANDVQLSARGLSLEYLGGWSNTGYLDLEVKKRPRISSGDVESSTATEVSAKVPFAPVTHGSTSYASKMQDKSGNSSWSLQQSSNTVPTKLVSTLVPPRPQSVKELCLVVKAVNSQEHLKNLKKTRGGIGNLKHDSSQKTVDSFFKRPKSDPSQAE